MLEKPRHDHQLRRRDATAVLVRQSAIVRTKILTRFYDALDVFVVELSIRNIVVGLLSYVLSCMMANADGVAKMLDLKLEATSECKQVGDLKLDGRCHKFEIGTLKITFVPVTSDLGLLSIEVQGNLDFAAVSTGRIFFYGSASGGIDPKSNDGDISIRSTFCLETADGLIGYAWDGGKYIKNEEATEFCPIDVEVTK